MPSKNVPPKRKKSNLEGEPFALPKHNFSTGAGWKSSKKHRVDFTIKRKVRG